MKPLMGKVSVHILLHGDLASSQHPFNNIRQTKRISRMEPMQGFTRLRNSDGRGPTALVSLGADNLVVVGAETHSELSPSVEVVSSSDSSAAALVPTDRPVLVEGGRSGNGRLVHLLMGVDIVDGSISGHGSLEGHAAAGVVFTIVLHDVILDKGAGGPPVDSKVSVSRGAESTREVDVSKVYL